MSFFQIDHGSTLVELVEHLHYTAEQNFANAIFSSSIDRSHYQLDYDKIALGQKMETVIA